LAHDVSEILCTKTIGLSRIHDLSFSPTWFVIYSLRETLVMAEREKPEPKALNIMAIELNADLNVVGRIRLTLTLVLARLLLSSKTILWQVPPSYPMAGGLTNLLRMNGSSL
jgi:hypothetical protein